MARNKPYGERFKVINVEGLEVIVHVTEDLTPVELFGHFLIAFETENWDYMQSLAAEIQSRGLPIPNVFGIKKEDGNEKP